jgi:SSS family solute:Na+ symporter/sodium/proline symporter
MIYFWAILIYLLILIGVGAIRSGAVKTQEDFMVAGRKLSAPVLVGTLLATWIGSGSIIGGAGLS